VLTRVIEPGRDPSTTPVGEVMSKDPVSIDHEATLEEAMAVMRTRRFRHLAVPVGELHLRQLLIQTATRATRRHRATWQPCTAS
jgi:signal-transduction protein with cAMP-binding, CBS, and nucleotidyltransferase domain